MSEPTLIPDLDLEPKLPRNDAAVEDAMARDDQDRTAIRYLPDGSVQVIDETGAVISTTPPPVPTHG